MNSIMLIISMGLFFAASVAFWAGAKLDAIFLMITSVSFELSAKLPFRSDSDKDNSKNKLKGGNYDIS